MEVNSPSNIPRQAYEAPTVLEFIAGMKTPVLAAVGHENDTLFINEVVDKYFSTPFEPYPTKNMYAFLLLDSLTGTVYQVQWSTESKNRGLVDVIY